MMQTPSLWSLGKAMLKSILVQWRHCGRPIWNILDNDWTLWTDGLGASTISYNIVTFLDEGFYTLCTNTFKEDGTELIDSHGPILIDSSGPTRSRYSWTWVLDRGCQYTVSGTVIEEYSSLSSLSVNASITRLKFSVRLQTWMKTSPLLKQRQPIAMGHQQWYPCRTVG